MKALASRAVYGMPVSRGMALPLGGSPARGGSSVERHEEAPGPAWHREVSDRAEPAAITSAVAITPPQCVSRRRLTWRGMAAETIDITPNGRLELRFRAPVHVLLLLETGAHAHGNTWLDDPPRSTPRAGRRELVLVPAGHDYVDLQATRGLARIACFYFDPPALPLDAAAAASPRLFFEDPELLKTALKLTEAVDMQGGDRHYCEALGIVLAHDLARFALHARRSPQKFRGGLAGWQQQAVATHIAHHLAERISLTSLAALVRLSPYHFSRAFKQSFGMPPHRYHTHRRIESAKALLANPDRSATEIGAIVGFSSASAFTMTFRKVTGITPSDYRRTLI